MRAADDEARGEGVSGSCRIDDFGRKRRCSSPSTTIPRAPRLTTWTPAATSPIASHSRSLPKTTSGRMCSSASRIESPNRSMCVQDERSTLTLAPCVRASAAARSAAPRDRRAHQRVAGEVQRIALEPGRVEILGAECGAEPRSEAIVRSPSGCTSETTTPVRSPCGPHTSTPRALEVAAERSRRRRRPPARRRLARALRARPPRRRRSPPARREPSVVAAAASSPGASRESSRTITSRSKSPRVHTTTVGLSRGRRGQAKRTAALLHVRRGARRFGGSRGRAAAASAAGGAPDARPGSPPSRTRRASRRRWRKKPPSAANALRPRRGHGARARARRSAG